MLRTASRRHFGLFGRLKDMASAPVKYANQFLASGTTDYSPQGNLTEKFDDEASEWRAVLRENAYDLKSLETQEAAIQPNFGTLDNPHLIFTADIPYRFVGCTGAPNEDDYEGHEIMYFLLREGPLQRCGSCGQVFKLVRLRQEVSAENDFYANDFVRTDIQEMGEADHWIQMNAIKFMWHTTFEHSHFEINTNAGFSLINTDDHDRLLVDPAFRLAQLAKAEHKHKVAEKIEERIYNSMRAQHDRPAIEFSKDTFENLLQSHVAAERLHNHFRAVQRFHTRSLFDKKKHEAREKRMAERALERSKEVLKYLDGFSEEQMKYRDYFESDDEALALLNVDVASVRAELLSHPDFQAKNFAWTEEYASTRDPDASSYVDKKIFRFNYRQAFYKPADHLRKEQRMRERMEQSGFAERLALAEKDAEKEAELDPVQFHQMVIQQALLNYKNYFESDLEEDFQYLEELPLEEKADFAATLAENGLLKQETQEYAEVLGTVEGEAEEGLFGKLWEEKLDAEGVDNLSGVDMNREVLERAQQKLNQAKQG